jgi:hypothetical protein
MGVFGYLVGFLMTVQPFRLLSIPQYIYPVELTVCPGLAPGITQLAKDAASAIRSHDFAIFVFDEGYQYRENVGTICTTHVDHMMPPAYTDPVTRNVYLSPDIIPFEHTLYNVLVHELLHASGLAHSKRPGMMNYSIRFDETAQVYIEDAYRQWLSLDDTEGLHLVRMLSDDCVFGGCPS